jgi:hypothetical protein
VEPNSRFLSVAVELRLRRRGKEWRTQNPVSVDTVDLDELPTAPPPRADDDGAELGFGHGCSRLGVGELSVDEEDISDFDVCSAGVLVLAHGLAVG